VSRDEPDGTALLGRLLRPFRRERAEEPQQPAPAPAIRVPVYVVGMSHTRALAAAIERDGADDVMIDRATRATMGADHPLTPEQLARYAPTVAISMMGGNQHNRIGLFESPEPFDFYLDADDTVLPGRRIVRHAEMRANIMEMTSRSFERTTELAGFYKVPTAHVASPPPVYDEAHLVETLAEKAAQLGLPLKFTPPSIRMKLYRLQNRILQEWCDQNGIDFLPAPADGQTADGFLAPQFRRNDPTHGNARYGKLVLAQIRRYAAGHGAAVAGPDAGKPK